jgi:hypothetical protein
MSDPPARILVLDKRKVGQKMTTLQKNKCKEINCTHSAKFVERYEIVENKVVLKHGQKWHFCQICDRVVHKNWINYHEMKCKSFQELSKNCIAKNHYELGVHSRGVACNL